MQAVAPSTQRRRTEAAGVHSINSRGLSPIRRNEVGVGVAAPLPRSSDGHITAITAQKEIVAARNRRKWTEVSVRSHPECIVCLADSNSASCHEL